MRLHSGRHIATGIAAASLLLLGCNSSQSGASSSSAPGARIPAEWTSGVTVHLKRIFDGGSVISFGLPVWPAAVPDAAAVRVRVKGKRESLPGLKVKPILFRYGKGGEAGGIRALLIQFPASAMTGAEMDVDIAWRDDDGPAPGSDIQPYAKIKQASPEVAHLADWRIARTDAGLQLVEKNPEDRQVYSGWEPRVLASYPPGYIAATGIMGEQMAAREVKADPGLKGLAFLSDYFGLFADGAMYLDGYRLNRASVAEPNAAFEGWLYDRCATFLTAYAHFGEERYQRHALRACSFYASKINPAGMFTLKLDWEGKVNDAKYSHVRGIYAYYALTGDESALEAGRNMANMWREEPFFVVPYRKGSARGPDKLWTERLLGASIEGLLYGFMLTGDAKYLAAAKELFETAYRHITTANQEDLDAITKVHFPPQNCFIHSAEQHEGAKGADPWCSGWMAELLVEPLLRYQELTGDSRVDEIFVRLVRAQRDAGSVYFRGNPQKDSFLEPSICFDPKKQGDNPRTLSPVYGFGLRADGSRYIFSEWDDFTHCADATALTAAGIRSLVRQGKFGRPGVGPFKTEGQSFVALHHEYAFCAREAFKYYSRTRRDPRSWKSEDLAAGYVNGDENGQIAFIDKEKIGYPVYQSEPQRRLSWWFNTSMLQFRLLDEAGMSFAALRPGLVQAPSGCPPAAKLSKAPPPRAPRSSR